LLPSQAPQNPNQQVPYLISLLLLLLFLLL
jgi:hypothetical protein